MATFDTLPGVFTSYGHLIYTRCDAAYQIDGTPMPDNAGYGIHTLSKDFAPQRRDLQDFLDATVRMYHYSARLTCPDHYYAYIIPPGGGEALLGRITPRTDSERSAAGAAGYDARCGYISEYFSGLFDRYPFEMMFSDAFSAHKRPIADYYSAACAPRAEQIPASQLPRGTITPAEVQRFITDGRAQAVQAAVAHLIRLFSDPQQEGKHLVIRDSEPNVRLWIAAITSCLPVNLARQVGFITSVPSFRETGGDYCYAVDQRTGEYRASMDMQESGQQMRLLAHILGADPDYNGPGSIIANPQPYHPYAVIDGKTRSVCFTPDASLTASAYITAIDGDPPAVRRFCTHLHSLTDVRFSPMLCELFEAITVLEQPTAQSYSAFLSAFRTLLPHFTAASQLMHAVMKQLLQGGLYTARFAAADARNDMALLNLLLSCAGRFGYDVSFSIRILADHMASLLSAPSSGQEAWHYWQIISRMGSATVRGVINTLVGEDGLRTVTFPETPTAPIDYLILVAELLQCYILQDASRSWRGLLDVPQLKPHVHALVDLSLTHQNLLNRLVSCFQKEPIVLDSLILRGAQQRIRDEESRLAWWTMLLNTGLQPASLCQTIAAAQPQSGSDGRTIIMSPADVETVLLIRMRHSGPSGQLHALYEKYLVGVPGAGRAYFGCWRQWLLTRSRSLASDAQALLKAISAVADYPPEELHVLLAQLDQRVTQSDDAGNGHLADVVLRFSQGHNCPNSRLWHYMHVITNGIAGMPDAPLLDRSSFVRLFADPTYVPSGLPQSGMGKRMMSLLTSQCDDPAATLIAVLSFYNCPEWFEAYARTATAACIRGKNRFLVILCQLLAMVHTDGFRRHFAVLADMHTPDRISDQLTLLQHHVQLCLNEARIGDMKRLMAACSPLLPHSPNASAILADMLQTAQEAQEARRSSGILGTLTSLFRRKPHELPPQEPPPPRRKPAESPNPPTDSNT